jgi:hypothetical protein
MVTPSWLVRRPSRAALLIEASMGSVTPDVKRPCRVRVV